MNMEAIREFLEALGASGEPFGMCYTNAEPAPGICPKSGTLPTIDDEKNRRIDWKALNHSFSCVIGLIWRARKKRCVAYFDREHFGCLGGAFYLGYMKSQLDAIACYVSTGIPGAMEGERYLPSPEITRKFFETVGPRPAPARYCVFQPLSLFRETEVPELVMFFEKPEVMSGLCTLAAFITNDFEAVKSPFGAGCTALVAWPIKYLNEGSPKAVLGGWDPSERKFMGRDEITLSMPYQMFEQMTIQWRNSFLTTSTWLNSKNRRE